MKRLKRELLLVMSVAFLYINLPLADSCSMPVGWKPPTIVDILNRFDTAIIATVKRRISEFRYSYSSQYSVEVEVHCVLKGSTSYPQVLKVTDAGYVPGLCYGTDLQAGKTYIIGLQRYNSAEAPAISESGFAEALTACKLNQQPKYPIGLSESMSRYRCPVGLPEGQCKDH